MQETLEQRGHIMQGVVVGEEVLGVLLSRIGVSINEVIVVLNGKIETNSDIVVHSNDKILVLPALEGG